MDLLSEVTIPNPKATSAVCCRVSDTPTLRQQNGSLWNLQTKTAFNPFKNLDRKNRK
jgi:hypothetical protein